MKQFQDVTALLLLLLKLWKRYYTRQQSDEYVQQIRALRGWFHFDAWRMWEKIPYVDENAVPDTVTNKGEIRSQNHC